MSFERPDDFYEVIERFKQIKIIDCQIISRENRIIEVEAKMEYGGVSTDPYKTIGGDCNAMENKITYFLEEKERLEKEVKQLKREYSALVKAFESLSTNEKVVIEEWLLKRNSLRHISVNTLFYSEKQLNRIKNAGLHKIYRCLSTCPKNVLKMS